MVCLFFLYTVSGSRGTSIDICRSGCTGRIITRRFEEHITSIENSNSSSLKCAQHVLETQHTHGIIDNAMETLDITNEGKL